MLFTSLKLNKKLKLITLVIIIFSLIYSLLDVDEFYHNHQDKIEEGHTNYSIYNLFHKLYFSLITTSTIGYGDITAKSIRAKIIVIIHILIVVYITYI